MPHIDPVFAWTSVAFLSLLWIASGLQKLRALAQHRITLARYDLLPRKLVPAFSILQIFLEFSLGLALLLPELRTPAAWASLALLLAYSTAIGLNLTRGRRDIDCGCGGWGLRQELSEGLIVRNLILVLVCGLPLLSASNRALGWLDGVTVVGGLLGATLVYTAANQLLAQSSRLAAIQGS